MTRNLKPLAAVLLAVILAITAQMLWVLVGSWIWQVYGTMFGRQRLYEDVSIQRDGTPVIISMPYSGYSATAGRRAARTLDGQPVSLEAPVYGTQFAPAETSDLATPLAWPTRIQSLALATNPAEFWYLVHDGERHGRAYYVAFQTETNLRLGYLDRFGFRTDLPPRENHFEVTSDFMRAHQSWPIGHEPWDQLHNQIAPRKRTSLLISPDGIREVDLGERSVRMIWKGGDALDIQPLVQLQRHLREVPEDPQSRWAVRESEQMRILSEDKSPIYSVVIPPALRHVPFHAYELVGGGLLYVARDRDPYEPKVLLHWLPRDGEEKSREVRLAATERTSPSVEWAAIGALLPGTLLTSAGVAIKALVAVLEGKAPSYTPALSQELGAAWPTLVVVALLGFALAAWTRRRHEAYGLPFAAGWATFVFLLGPAGLAAYLWHRTWSVRSLCPACNAVVPLDRETCLRCTRPFPPPARLSTEIHA